MSTLNLFNISGRKLFCCLLIISFDLPLRAEESIAPERVELEGHAKIQIPEKENLENLTWEGKKVLVGMGALSGIGMVMGMKEDPVILFPFKIIQISCMGWITPEIPIIFNGSFNASFLGGVGGLFPLLLNVGYNRKEGNQMWYLAGGGGFNMLLTVNRNSVFDPIINLGTGIEWLVSKSYALGVKLNIGLIIMLDSEDRDYYGKPPDQLFIDFSFTANLAL